MAGFYSGFFDLVPHPLRAAQRQQRIALRCGHARQTVDALFRRARDRAGLSGFTFHDARHTAATRLAGKLDVLTLCKVFGWTNPAQAMAYYNPSPGEIARRMR